MSRFKMTAVLIFCLILCGCKEYGEKRIVKFVTIDEEKISVIYYDFSSEEPSYIEEEKENKGINSTLVSIFSENYYNLKLCRFVIVSENILKNSFKELYFALTDNRFAMDTVILKGDTSLEASDYNFIKNDNYPLYNYSYKDEQLKGVVEVIVGNEKILVKSNGEYIELTSNQSKVFDILSGVISECVYVTENQTENISAELKNISVFYTTKEDVLNIHINAVLKTYKGRPSDEINRKYVKNMVEQEIHNMAENMLADESITDYFMVGGVKNNDSSKLVNVEVKVI